MLAKKSGRVSAIAYSYSENFSVDNRGVNSLNEHNFAVTDALFVLLEWQSNEDFR